MRRVALRKKRYRPPSKRVNATSLRDRTSPYPLFESLREARRLLFVAAHLGARARLEDREHVAPGDPARTQPDEQVIHDVRRLRRHALLRLTRDRPRELVRLFPALRPHLLRPRPEDALMLALRR